LPRGAAPALAEPHGDPLAEPSALAPLATFSATSQLFLPSIRKAAFGIVLPNTPTPIATATVPPGSTATFTATPSPTASATATPTAAGTATNTPTATATQTPTPTATPTSPFIT